MYWVYIICSLKTGRYYVGSTKDIEKRIQEHNNNKTKSLRNKGPFYLVYKEKRLTLSDARKRERQIKRYKSGNAFKKLVDTIGDKPCGVV